MLPEELGSCNCHKSEFRPNIPLFSIFAPISALCCIPRPSSFLIWTRLVSVPVQYKVCLLSLLQKLWVSYHITKSLIICWTSLPFLSCPYDYYFTWFFVFLSFWLHKQIANDHKGKKISSCLFFCVAAKRLARWLYKAHMRVAKAGGSGHWGTWITQAQIFKNTYLGTIFLSQQLHTSSLFVRLLETLLVFKVERDSFTLKAKLWHVKMCIAHILGQHKLI